MNEWVWEKVNMQKSGKYIYRFYIKIWNDLNGRLTVARDNKYYKGKYECGMQEWRNEWKKKVNKPKSGE